MPGMHISTLPRGAVGLGRLSLPDITNVLFVDKSSEVGSQDGTQQNPYHTIQAAITAANALAAVATPYLVYVYPGIYDEAITLSTDYVYLAGANRDTTIVENSGANVVTITSDLTSINDLTIRASSTRRTISMGVAASNYVPVFNCILAGATANNYVDASLGAMLRFVDCAFVSDVDGVVLLTLTATTDVLVENCAITGGLHHRQGSLLVQDSSILAEAVDGILMNTAAASLSVRNSHIVSTNNSAIMVNFAPVSIVLQNNLMSANAASYAIGAGVAVTGAVVEDNILTTGLGIDPDVSHVAPHRNVGSNGMRDWYATTQNALDSCTFDGITVHLLKDEATAALLRPPDFCVIVDGHNHTISRAGGVLTILSGECIITKRLGLVGKIVVAGTNGQLYLTDRSSVLGGIQFAVTSAGAMLIQDTEIVGSAVWNYPVQIDTNPGFSILINRSRLEGVSGSPAVYWTSANDDLSIKYSTLWHGSGAGNNPFGRSAAQTPDYKSYQSAYNSDPEAGGIWTNLVAAGQRCDSLDVNTNY